MCEFFIAFPVFPRSSDRMPNLLTRCYLITNGTKLTIMGGKAKSYYGPAKYIFRFHKAYKIVLVTTNWGFFGFKQR